MNKLFLVVSQGPSGYISTDQPAAVGSIIKTKVQLRTLYIEEHGQTIPTDGGQFPHLAYDFQLTC